MSVLENGKPDRPKSIDLRKVLDDPNSFSILSEKEKEAIRAKAREKVKEEEKQRAEDALYQQCLKEERQKADPDEQLVPIFLTLAGHCEYIMLDGTMFYNERLYEVTPRVFSVLIEQQARGWAHEDETEVRDMRSRRRNRPPPHVGGANFMDRRQERNLVVSSGQLQGSSPSALLGIKA